VKLKRLEIAGFRGFAGRHELDLDADAVIVVGANGQGKTSLFDAVLWGLTGELPRVGAENVISLYSQTGGTRVEVELAGEGETVLATRSLGEGQDGLRLSRGDEVFEGLAADATLLEFLWPEASQSKESISALTAATTRSVYLQQDLVREFIEGESHQDRFRAISQLVGAGTVSELTIALDKAKTAWSGATNSLAERLRQCKIQLQASEARLEELSAPSGSIDEELVHNWALWWQVASEFDALEGEIPSPESVEAPRALDSAMRQIAAFRASLSRRILALEELVDRLGAVPDEEPVDLEQLREEVTEAAEEDAEVRRVLSVLEAEAVERRRRQIVQVEQVEEARALAEIALRHLEGPCPVCGQAHDPALTRVRLEGLISASSQPGESEAQIPIAELAERLSQAEAKRIEVAEKLNEAEVQQRERALAEADLQHQLTEFDVQPGAGAKRGLEELAERSRAESAALDAQLESGERLALELARAGERALRRELEESVESSRAQVAELESEVDSKMRTRKVAGHALEELRETAAEVVSIQLQQIKPILRRIYRTIDPHPSLRTIDLTPDFSGRRGELMATLTDSFGAKRVEQPASVLSSSQMNALAVSIFLSLNLGLPRLPLETVMLDDPLQSLDDVNLLGLIDLLRRARESRQLIVSTHDRRFAHLLVRKLRPVGAGRRTRVIELDGWSRSGPAVTQVDAPSESQRLRIAA
jgi:DNA repair exonuclease SbcCD ATPase subunit